MIIELTVSLVGQVTTLLQVVLLACCRVYAALALQLTPTPNYVVYVELNVYIQGGNGVIDAGEICDDGNLQAQDGCYKCSVELAYVCTALSPSTCQLMCGNGVIDLIEQCDDGNYLQYDGCFGCQVEQSYLCSGTPSICKFKCGNGVRDSPEQCDDGNSISGDGCSMNCKVEMGFSCGGGNATTNDTCSVLCGNGMIDVGEECDDKFNLGQKGCLTCVVMNGWSCVGSVCSLLCGDGLRQQNEQCDDGNTQSKDGCTNCLIDQDYRCNGGSLISKDTCSGVPDICGDGYKKSNEKCEDGNQIDGDGCSHSCIVETGYQCQAGIYAYSIQKCTPICGDGLVITPETCDDGNLINGDGCSSVCQIEGRYCGNGIREANEHCDDGNTINGDGCSDQCNVEVAWTCHLVIGGTTDICQRCVYQCSNCVNNTIQGCSRCLQGYYMHQPTGRCEPHCPSRYYENKLQCSLCASGCSGCLGISQGQCTECDDQHYFKNGDCLQSCGSGYFVQLNAVYGNICVGCFSPCLICSNAVICQQCGDLYYTTDSGSCQLCEMGSNCLACDKKNNLCTKCTFGFNPVKNTYNQLIYNRCILIADNCGDGLKSNSEMCDDGNTQSGDGCGSKCTIETGYNCVQDFNQGPSECFKLVPLDMITYTDKVHFDTLYIQFTRPLSQSYNFSNLVQIDIPAINGYSYTLNVTKPNLLQIEFTFNSTVLNQIGYLNFSKPTQVVDKFGWSLVGQQNDTQSFQLTKSIVVADLNYYISYTTEEQQFAQTFGLITLSFACLATLSSFAYAYKIGDGRQWKLIESMQLLGMMRFVNFRYSLHMNMVFQYLNYFSLAFIPNLFDLLSYDDSLIANNTPPNFQLQGYSPLFLLSAGGRFISIMAYLLVFWGLVHAVYKLITWEALQNILEDILDYIQFQAFIRFYEVIFLDLMISTFLNFSALSLQDSLQNASFAVAFILFLSYFALSGLFVYFVVIPTDSASLEWLHKYAACVYDGYNLRTHLGKCYMLVPYLQKLLTAAILVGSSDPKVQVSLILIIRAVPLFPYVKFNPLVQKALMIREVIIEAMNFITLATTFKFLLYYDQKQSKIQSGLVVTLAILLNTIHWIVWNIGFSFIQSQIKTPQYMIEEAEGVPQMVPQDSVHDDIENKNAPYPDEELEPDKPKTTAKLDYMDAMRLKKQQRKAEQEAQNQVVSPKASNASPKAKNVSPNAKNNQNKSRVEEQIPQNDEDDFFGDNIKRK